MKQISAIASPLQVSMHPDDPINTAASVATAAPAFSIRRLVLFVFIGCAFHLRGSRGWHL
jgi:hypothetical protein